VHDRNKALTVRFQVLKAADINMADFWVVAPFTDVSEIV
jgi:hypothetical protein